MGLDYITSGQFIHDDLLQEAEDGLEAIPRWWRKHGRIPPSLILWPRDRVTCDDGTHVEDKIHFDLPEDPSTWQDLIQKAVERTQAYAMFFISQRKNEVRAIFESPHGAKSWHFPLVKHGPDVVLGDCIDKVGASYIGLLWRPTPEEETPPPQPPR